MADGVLRADEERVFFKYPLTKANARAFQTVKAAVLSRRLVARACYCSVFNECWQGGFTGLHPTPVDRCVPLAVGYQQ